MDLPLVLIGLLGAGKTSIGSKLAAKLDLDFYDMDQLIEVRTGQSVTSFFASQGERKFREMESGILSELIVKEKSVIATGGGAVLSPQNRALLKERAFCICLDVDVDTLYQRLKNDDTRPLLQGTDLKHRLQELKTQREAYYQECAHLIIHTQEKSMAQIIDEVVEQLG